MKKHYYIYTRNLITNEFELKLMKGDLLKSSVADYKYFVSKDLKEDLNQVGYTATDLITGLLIIQKKTKKELIEAMNQIELIEKIQAALKNCGKQKKIYVELLEVKLEENAKDNIIIKDLIY